jgi:hypothetical protein
MKQRWTLEIPELDPSGRGGIVDPRALKCSSTWYIQGIRRLFWMEDR